MVFELHIEYAIYAVAQRIQQNELKLMKSSAFEGLHASKLDQIAAAASVVRQHVKLQTA